MSLLLLLLMRHLQLLAADWYSRMLYVQFDSPLRQTIASKLPLPRMIRLHKVGLVEKDSINEFISYLDKFYFPEANPE